MVKISIIILLCLVTACDTGKKKDSVQVCKTGFKPTDTLNLKLQNTIISLSTDPRTVRLLLGKYTSPDFPEAKKVADSALHVASVLLSSSDFKTAIAKLDFTCRNFGDYCNSKCKKCSDRFNGNIVFDYVFRDKEVTLDLFLNDCNDEFGHSTHNIKEIYSCQPIVFYDEKQLSHAYCYAYHIAHEYMHIVGFFHTNHIDDVAEKTGWIGWEILLKWKRMELNVMQVQPGQQ